MVEGLIALKGFFGVDLLVWLLIASFFCWLIYREFRQARYGRKGYPLPESVYKPYVAICAILALFFVWQPLKYWRIERRLSLIATQLADNHLAKLHCNTAFDAIFDNDPFAAGHASFETGQIVFQYPWCGMLMDYLDHPDRASLQELHSLNMLTHESMHVRGERNEARTECQAIQRNYRTAKLLGVSEEVARRNAAAIYTNNYLKMKTSPDRVAAYYSDECAPGRSLDEALSDSTWQFLD